MGRILLLVAKRSYRAQAFLDAAERLGVEVVVGSDHRPALADRVPGHAIELPLADLEAGTQSITAFARTHPLDAVLAAEDDGALLAAHAAAALGLTHNAPDAIGAARFKHRMRERLAAAGVPVPEYRVVAAGDDPIRAAAGLPFPRVVKPVALAASRGVIRVDDERELAAAVRRVERLLEDPEVTARGGDAARVILIEEYVAGPEVAVEGLLTGGRLEALAVFDKPDPLEGPAFEETIYVTPSRWPPAVQDEIVATTARTAEALGLVTGPIHAELRLAPRGPVVIEIAPRSIGGLCSRVLRFGKGRISLEERILQHALGREIRGLRREAAAAGVMMIPIPRRGILRGVRGLAAARAVPAVDEVTITIPLDQELVPLPEGSRYLGFIFARAGEPADAEAALRTAHALLGFDIEA